MRDTEVVASIVARDPAGVAEAYDRYAVRIFSFCRSLLGEPADAAGAVQDTFVIAAVAVSELYDPARLRPWLYAVARNECHRRLQAGNRPAAEEETTGLNGQADDVYDDTRAQPKDLVRAAILRLDLADQEVVELSRRHRLHGPDLADTLGVPRQHVDALVSRARAELETWLGALVVAQAGRKACPDLEHLVSGADGTTTAHYEVSAHIAGCAVCRDCKRQVLGPVMRLGFATLTPIPHELRDQVLYLATDPSPATAARRDAIAQRAGAFGVYGFPAARASAAGARPRWRLAPKPMAALTTTAATAVVAAVAGVLVLMVPQMSHQSDSAQPANLSSPASPAAHSGAGGQPTAAAGKTGTAASGTRGHASAAGIQGGIRQDHSPTGTVAQQGGSLYAVSGAQNTAAGGAGTGAASAHPVTQPSSPGKVTKSTAPVKTVGPVTSPTPVLSPTPTQSPTPTGNPTPVTSPTPTPSVTPPTVSSSTPTGGATIGVSVGDLLSVGVQLGS